MFPPWQDAGPRGLFVFYNTSMPKAAKRELIAIDTEATGLDVWHGARPFFVTVCRADGRQHWWEWPVDPATRMPAVPDADLAEVRELIETCDLVGQNIRFDAHALLTLMPDLRWPWERCTDTLVAGHLLASNRPHNLTDMCLEALGLDLLPYEDALEAVVKKARAMCRSKAFQAEYGIWRIANKGLPEMPSAGETTWKMDSWLPLAIADRLGYPPDHPWRTVLRDYANADSAATLALWRWQEGELRARGLGKIFAVRMRLPGIAAGMERRGVTLSRARLDEQRDRYRKGSAEAAEACEQIALESGYELTMPKGGNSKALREFCFYNRYSNEGCPDGLRLPPVKVSEKTGEPSLDKAVLEEYGATLTDDRQLTFVKALRAKRSQDTAATYLDGYERFWKPLTAGVNGHAAADPDWRRLHPSLNMCGTDTLRWSSSAPNCVDAETEFLTEHGWVRADELTPVCKLAQYWSETETIDFVSPVRLVKQRYTGGMRRVLTEQHIDLLVTPNHRCLVKNRRTGRKFDVQAKDLVEDHHYYHAGVYVGGDIEFTDDEVTWLCAVQADGHYCAVDGADYGITFAFRKARKIDRLKACMDRLAIPYSTRVDEDKGTRTTCFYVGKHADAVVRARSMMPDKCFGPWLLDLSRSTLDKFVKEVFRWDGDYTRGASWTSSDKKSADWVQILFTLSNSRAYLASRWPSSTLAKRIHHYVNIAQGRNYSLTTNYSQESVDWDDYVYCVEVPSSYVVIRRNGRVSITGNSQNVSKKELFNLRYCFGPGPGREWWSLDAQNIELRIPTFEAGEQELMDVFLRPKEPPYYGSYHLAIFDLLHPEMFAEHGKKCKDLYESTWYQWVKNGNFAVIYGCQEAKADATYHVPGAFARIRGRFPKIAELSDRLKWFADKRGYVETIPDKSVDPARGYPVLCSRTEWGRVLPTVPLNYHTQSTACWWMGMAMIRVADFFAGLNAGRPFAGVVWKGGYYLAMQIHDELVLDLPKGKGAEPWRTNLPVVCEVKRQMELGGDGIGVPTPVAVEYNAESWDKGLRVGE